MKSLPRRWIPLSKEQSKKLGFALSNRTITGIAVNGICVFPLCRAVKNLFMSEYSKLQTGCMTGGKQMKLYFGNMVTTVTTLMNFRWSGLYNIDVIMNR